MKELFKRGVSRVSSLLDLPDPLAGTKSTWANSICLFDNLRAIAIFAICFRHAAGLGLFGDPGGAVRFFASAAALFAIPVFAFASGYGQKNFSDTSYFSRFLSVYIAATLVNIPYYLWDSYQSGFDIWLYALFPGPPGTTGTYIWYFLAMLLWRAFSPLVLQMRYPLVFASVLSIICPADMQTLIQSVGNGQEGELVSAIVKPIYFTIKFFPFYLAGVLATRDQILGLRNFSAKWLFVPLAMAGVYLFGRKHLVYYSTPDELRIHSIAYFFLAFATLAAFVAFVPGKPIRWLTSLGQRSFPIYFLHILFIVVLVKGLKKLNLDFNFSFAGPIVALFLAGIVAYLVSYILARTPVVNAVNSLSQFVERCLFPKQRKSSAT